VISAGRLTEIGKKKDSIVMVMHAGEAVTVHLSLEQYLEIGACSRQTIYSHCALGGNDPFLTI